MDKKINNRELCSIGKYFGMEVPIMCQFDPAGAVGLDYYEERLFRCGKPLKLVGFWVPTGDYSYVRVFLDISEVSPEVVPFERFAAFLFKMDAVAKQAWEKELERQYEDALKSQAESDKQKELDAADPHSVAVRNRMLVLRGERNILLNRRDSCLTEKSFGSDDGGVVLRTIEDRLRKNKEELLTFGVKIVE